MKSGSVRVPVPINKMKAPRERPNVSFRAFPTMFTCAQSRGVSRAELRLSSGVEHWPGVVQTLDSLSTAGLRRLRQEDHRFQASLGYTGNSGFKDK